LRAQGALPAFVFSGDDAIDVRDAPGMVARRVKALSDQFDETLVVEAERKVRENGAMAPSKLLPKGLSRAGQALFLEALGRRGLEHTGKHLRVPVDEQVKARLASDGPIPLSSLAKRLAGVTAVEAKRAVTRLVSAGSAVWVMRDGKDVVAPPSVDALSSADLEVLKQAARKIETMLKWVKPKKGVPPRTLLRDDIGNAAWLLSAKPAPVGARTADAERMVLDTIMRLADARTGLARVPDVVRAVGGQVAREEAIRAMLTLDRAGTIELRPESGIGLLSEADAALCPRGPRAVPLSFVRVVEDGPLQARR